LRPVIPCTITGVLLSILGSIKRQGFR
jgi:hypothetical protein